MASLKLLCAFASIAAAQTASVAGLVVDANNDPVRKAVVTLTWQGTPRSWATARTDSSGRFVIENLPAGKYDLRAAKEGAGSAIYGARSTREMGDFLILKDGEQRTDIKLHMIAVSSISGRILDPDGDPIPYATASLLRMSRDLGKPVAVHYLESPTDDHGQFHFSRVDPGEYFLRALAGPQFEPSRIYESQFWPGAADVKDARPVMVRSGENLAGLDFHLNPATPVRIRGRVGGLPAGRDDLPSVVLQPANEGDRGRANVTVRFQPDGHFEFPPVPAGRYRVIARTILDGKAAVVSELVDAQPGMGDVVLSFSAGITLNGTLTLESPGAQKPSAFTVVLSSVTDGSAAKVADDGKFSFDHVMPGEYELNLQPVPRGGFIKSARLGDRDILFEKFSIDASTKAALNIVVSMRGATVEGQIENTRAAILLAPVGKFHDLARFYYGIATDAEGKFKLVGVAPGKYKILAVEKMLPAAIRTVEAADRLGDGEILDIAEGATITAHPKLIPIDRARELLP